MAAVAATYLADTSALARASQPAVRERFAGLLEGGLVATCSVIDLEWLYGARNADEHERWRAKRALAYELVPLEQPTFDRAVQVQHALAERGSHRGVPVVDLMIAAAAERAGLTVLHYDADFDLIAQVTGQAVEWVVPRGEAD